MASGYSATSGRSHLRLRGHSMIATSSENPACSDGTAATLLA